MPCLVVFGGGSGEKPRLEEDADAAAAELDGNPDGLARFENDGKPVFVNAQNVLWVWTRPLAQRLAARASRSA